MPSPARGLLRIGLGAGALYFVFVRNMDVLAEWYNDRYMQRKQQQDLARALAQEKQAMLAQSGS